VDTAAGRGKRVGRYAVGHERRRRRERRAVGTATARRLLIAIIYRAPVRTAQKVSCCDRARRQGRRRDADVAAATLGTVGGTGLAAAIVLGAPRSTRCDGAGRFGCRRRRADVAAATLGTVVGTGLTAAIVLGAPWSTVCVGRRRRQRRTDGAAAAVGPVMPCAIILGAPVRARHARSLSSRTPCRGLAVASRVESVTR
jgi:hypothetical protein